MAASKLAAVRSLIRLKGAVTQAMKPLLKEQRTQKVCMGLRCLGVCSGYPQHSSQVCLLSIQGRVEELWKRINDWLHVKVDREDLWETVQRWTDDLSGVTVNDLIQQRFPWGHFNGGVHELAFTILHEQATMRSCVEELDMLHLEVVHAWWEADRRYGLIESYLSKGYARFAGWILRMMTSQVGLFPS